jgi:hypothetical protein
VISKSATWLVADGAKRVPADLRDRFFDLVAAGLASRRHPAEADVRSAVVAAWAELGVRS